VIFILLPPFPLLPAVAPSSSSCTLLPHSFLSWISFQHARSLQAASSFSCFSTVFTRTLFDSRGIYRSSYQNISPILRWSKTAEVGSRTETLALITLIPLLANPHHALLADLLGISLQTIRLVHRFAGAAVPLLSLLHVLVVISTVSFGLNNIQDTFAVIVRTYPQTDSKN